MRREKHELVHHAQTVLDAGNERQGFAAAVERQVQLARAPVEGGADILARVVETAVVEFLRLQSGRGDGAGALHPDSGAHEHGEQSRRVAVALYVIAVAGFFIGFLHRGDMQSVAVDGVIRLDGRRRRSGDGGACNGGSACKERARHHGSSAGEAIWPRASRAALTVTVPCAVMARRSSQNQRSACG